MSDFHRLTLSAPCALVASLCVLCGGVLATDNQALPFQLYTRVTSETWPKLKPFATEGDLFWGRRVEGIPAHSRALTVSSYPALEKILATEDLRTYAAVNLDGEGRDFDASLKDARAIRALVDSHNASHNSDPAHRPLRFVAFYHMRIIDAHPEIVGYPDVVLVGKSYWTAGNIAGQTQGERRRRTATSYLKLIRDAGREPGILLGSPEKGKHDAAEILKTFKTCLAPVSEGGLGVRIIGFYFERDEANTLLAVLREARSNTTRTSLECYFGVAIANRSGDS